LQFIGSCETAPTAHKSEGKKKEKYSKKKCVYARWWLLLSIVALCSSFPPLNHPTTHITTHPPTLKHLQFVLLLFLGSLATVY